MTDLTSLVPQDEALQERAVALMWRMVEEAEDILERGSTRDKITLIKANLPALTRAIHTDEASQMANVREAVGVLMSEVRGGLLPPAA